MPNMLDSFQTTKKRATLHVRQGLNNSLSFTCYTINIDILKLLDKIKWVLIEKNRRRMLKRLYRDKLILWQDLRSI